MSALDLTPVAALTPEQLRQVAEAYISPAKGLNMGGYIAGFMVDAILLGVVLHQSIHWFQYSRAEDRLIVQLLVYFSLVMSVGISIYLAVWIFHMFVYGYGEYSVFFEVQWMSVWFMLDVIVRVPVQAFFAERAWRLSGRRHWFAGIILVLFTGALVLGITIKIIVNIPELSKLAGNLILVWLALEIAADVLTTVTIFYCLWTSRTGWSGTDKLIGRLLRLILETQFPPTLFAILFLIFYVCFPIGSITSFFVCAPKVYAVVLFAVLNARHSLRADITAEQTYTKGNSYVLRGMRGANTGINVTTETYTHVTRDPYAPARSVNRDPKQYDLEVTDAETANSTDKEMMDLDNGPSDLGYSSSVVRLTGEDERSERSERSERKDTNVRFGA